jgi:hypothetical protein
MQLVDNYHGKSKIKKYKMLQNTKKITLHIIYIIIIIIIITNYKIYHNKIYNKIDSFNYFKTLKAIKNNDKKTIKYFSKKIINNSRNNIYKDLIYINLYDMNKNKFDNLKSFEYINKIKYNKNYLKTKHKQIEKKYIIRKKT